MNIGLATTAPTAVQRWMVNNMAAATKKVLADLSDYVKVVRCKDCIFHEANSCFNRQWDLESSTEVPMVRENDFCSYGEREEQK